MFLLHEVLKISRKSTTPRPVSPRGTVCVHFTLTLFVPKRVKNQNKLTNLNSKLKLNKIQSSKLITSVFPKAIHWLSHIKLHVFT